LGSSKTNPKMAEIFRIRKKPLEKGDWTQTERAQFYRVGATLNRIGLVVETESGLSDEGDPWFVFCRSASDDVIIHFARCGDVYVIAAPGQPVVRGHDFSLLIEGLIARYAPFVDLAKADKKTIILHPSALLFALIVSCLFHAEYSEAHSLSFAPEDRPADSEGLQCPDMSWDAGSAIDRDGSSNKNHDREVIFAYAAAIGSAVTLEQWEKATATIDPDIAAPMDQDTVHEASSYGPESDLDNISFAVTEEHGGLHQAQTSVQDITASVTHMAVPKADKPHLMQAKPFIASIVLNEAGTHNEEPAKELLYAPSHTAAVRIFPVAPLVASSDLVTIDQVQAPAETAANHSEAYIDVLHVLGNLMTSHEASDTGTSEAHFVLQLLTEQTSEIKQNASPAAIESTAQTSGTLDEKSISGNANDGVVSAASVAPSSGPSKSSVPANDSQVEKAVDDFIDRHPDFQLIDTLNEIIIYDTHISARNTDQIEIVSYHFSDGSSVVLVGLGHEGFGHEAAGF